MASGTTVPLLVGKGKTIKRSKRKRPIFLCCLPCLQVALCYVLKGEVHHNIRVFKEEERRVLVSVTLMKGMAGFKDCANYESDLKEIFLSFFLLLFFFLCHPHL